jgi:catechol 2,3-dioxygenase-like lactoylglutathione lyase family enzyme
MLAKYRAYATIPAKDIARAKRWYEEKLGLKPATDAPYGSMYRLADGTGFVLYPTEFAGKAPNTLMGFVTRDVEGDVKKLKAKGVKFEEYDMPGLKTVNSIATMGPMKGAWFKDSEGNILSIGNEPA